MSGKPVYVYNGYHDLKLQFDGKWFEFPYEKTTVVNDYYTAHPDEWKRNHPSNPDGSALLERNYSAREFVEQLFNRHSQNLIGEKVVWIGDREPNAKEIERVNEFGRIRKMKQVEEALAERRSALAKGGKPDLDPTIVEWMTIYGIHDDTYNRKPEVDLAATLTEALTRVAQQAQQPVAAGRR